VIPPVVLFRNDEGLLLADGSHRLAAARQRGETSITADIRVGPRADALFYAATVAAAQRGMSTEEVISHILRRAAPDPDSW
jgi:ParB-like chromosome segregation protein Spo0J